jgi:YcxB-like protein
MHLEYQLESNDYVESAPLHSPNAVARFFYLLLGLQIVPFFLGLALGNFGKFSWQSLFSLTPQILIWLGVIEIQKFFYRRRLAAAWRDESHMSQSAVADIDDAGITFQEPHSTTNHPWETFRQVKEAKQSFLMFVSNRRFYIVPKRALISSGELEMFRQIITEKIPKNRRNGVA